MDASASSSPGPLGDADGARESLGRAIVPFGELTFGSPGSQADDVGIVAGKLGSGKTLWLRHLELRIRTSRDGRKVKYSNYAPRTDQLILLNEIISNGRGPLTWELVWDRAIIMAAACHVLYGTDDLRDAPRLDVEAESLLKLFPRREVDLYQAFQRLSTMERSRSSLAAMLRDPGWEELRWVVAQVAERRPPTYLLTDAIDESFGMSPAMWIECQRGLLTALSRWNATPALSRRVKLIVAVRDLVITSMSFSEHSPRIFGGGSLVIMEWKRQDLERLVVRRLLGDEDDASSSASALLEGVLGLRGSDIWSKLLNLSNGVPRDVVNYGNALVHESQGERWGLEAATKTLHRAARASGRAKLAVASNEINARMFDSAETQRGARRRLGSDLYQLDTADNTLVQLYSMLERSIAADGHLTDIGALSEDSLHVFGVDAIDVLWRHGLLGVVDGRELRMYSTRDWDSYRLPRFRSLRYSLHPSLLASLSLPVDGFPYRVVYGSEWDA